MFVVYNDDCKNKIDFFKKNNVKFDLILTDPPYNISKDNNFSTMKSADRKGIDFGEWDKDFDVLGWIENFSDLVKKDGSIIIFCSYRYISFIVDKLEKNGFIAKDFIEWKKSNPMPRNINRRYVQDTEFAIWAIKKGAKWTFNKPDDISYLRSAFTAPVVSGKEKLGHPTQKSLKIIEELIKIHSNEGDLILDPFMGSGTTGAACVSLNRNFIGIELDKNYFNMAKERIENATN